MPSLFSLQWLFNQITQACLWGLKRETPWLKLKIDLIKTLSSSRDLRRQTASSHKSLYSRDACNLSTASVCVMRKSQGRRAFTDWHFPPSAHHFCGPRSHTGQHEHRERSSPTAVDPPSDLGDLREPLALGRVAHTQHTSTLCRGRYQPDRTLLRPRGLHALRHAHTHKHTHTPEVASGVGRNLEKARSPGNFTEWPVCKSRTIAASLHLFIPPSLPPSILPSIQGKERVKPWFMSHEFSGQMFSRDTSPGHWSALRWILCLSFWKINVNTKSFSNTNSTSWDVVTLILLIFQIQTQRCLHQPPRSAIALTGMWSLTGFPFINGSLSTCSLANSTCKA